MRSWRGHARRMEVTRSIWYLSSTLSNNLFFHSKKSNWRNLLPLQKEAKASPLPHISHTEVEGSKGKQNVDLSSTFPRDPQAVNVTHWPHKPFDLQESLRLIVSSKQNGWSGQLLSLCPAATGKSQCEAQTISERNEIISNNMSQRYLKPC